MSDLGICIANVSLERKTRKREKQSNAEVIFNLDWVAQ